MTERRFHPDTGREQYPRKRNFASNDDLQKSRARGGRRGSRNNALTVKLDKLLGPIEEEETP